MSVQDATAPPVIFVVGTAGAGKSSLATSLFGVSLPEIPTV